MATEKDLEQLKMAWREIWTETTVDPMWDLLSTVIVMKNGKSCVPHCEHRDELYIQINKEKDELIQQRIELLDQLYLLEVNPHHVRSRGSNTVLQTVQSHPAAGGPHSTWQKHKQPHHVRRSGSNKDSQTVQSDPAVDGPHSLQTKCFL